MPALLTRTSTSVHDVDGVGQSGFDLHEVGDIGDDGFGDLRELLTDGCAGLGVAVEDADARAFFQKARGSGSADSAGASGDEDSFIFQTAHFLWKQEAEFYQPSRGGLTSAAAPYTIAIGPPSLLVFRIMGLAKNSL
jgi:hypothetical protein